MSFDLIVVIDVVRVRPGGDEVIEETHETGSMDVIMDLVETREIEAGRIDLAVCDLSWDTDIAIDEAGQMFSRWRLFDRETFTGIYLVGRVADRNGRKLP